MSTKKLVHFFAVVLAVAVSAASAQAQHNSSIREGFWLSGGLGYGSLGCDNCGGQRESGVSGMSTVTRVNGARGGGARGEAVRSPSFNTIINIKRR